MLSQHYSVNHAVLPSISRVSIFKWKLQTSSEVLILWTTVFTYVGTSKQEDCLKWGVEKALCGTAAENGVRVFSSPSAHGMTHRPIFLSTWTSGKCHDLKHN